MKDSLAVRHGPQETTWVREIAGNRRHTRRPSDAIRVTSENRDLIATRHQPIDKHGTDGTGGSGHKAAHPLAVFAVGTSGIGTRRLARSAIATTS